MHKDIYFHDDFGKLYEEIDGGKQEVFHYQNNEGKIKHQFIKRKIEQGITDQTLFDITSPYGYGGPIIVEGTSSKQLIEGFYNEFEKYCKQENIVSEFVRFHPIANNENQFKSIYDIQTLRKTVATELKPEEDIMLDQFSKSCRKKIRKALKQGVEYRITEAPESPANFTDVYYSTMDRNKASDYYYFSEDYFNKCIKYFKDNVVLVEALYEEKVIAAGFYFVANGIIHTHLSGTLTEYLELSPAYILRYAIALWGQDNNYKLIHHGGGTTNSENDGLFAFKKRFGNKLFDFSIGKKIWNEEIYDKLTEGKNNNGFFPLYRS